MPIIRLVIKSWYDRQIVILGIDYNNSLKRLLNALSLSIV